MMRHAKSTHSIKSKKNSKNVSSRQKSKKMSMINLADLVTTK